MLADFLGLRDLAVIDLALSSRECPDRIVAPAAATLNEDTHGKSVADGKHLVLVADEGEHHKSEEVVVDMEITAGRKTFRVENDEADKDNSPDNIANHNMACLEACKVEV